MYQYIRIMHLHFAKKKKKKKKKKIIIIIIIYDSGGDCPLTHFILNRLSHTIYWKSPMSILDTPGYENYIFLEKNG